MNSAGRVSAKVEEAIPCTNLELTGPLCGRANGKGGFSDQSLHDPVGA